MRLESSVNRLLDWKYAAQKGELPQWTARRAFRPWLSRQVTRTDEIGSLARHADEDRAFPANPALVVTHLAAHLADGRVLAAARGALREYVAWLEADFEREASEVVKLGQDPANVAAVRGRTAESLEILRELLAEEIGS